jgi:arylsulfatase A-like enzyme
MTGMRPDHTKVWDLKTQMRDMNPDIVTLPQYLISQGYNTVGGGKIYHPSSAIKKIDPVSWNLPYLEQKASDYANGLGAPANRQYQKPENKALFAVKKERVARDNDDEEPTTIKGPSSECIDVPDNAYEDGVLALQAKEQLIKMAKDTKPYFMAVGFHKPHLPFVAPKKYWDLYKRADIVLEPFQEQNTNPISVAYHNAGEIRAYTDIPADIAATQQKGFGLALSTEKQKELIHGYYAAISYTDALVGKLLNTIDSLGLASNTIIVLWGDHGWHLGDHNIWCKHSNFEQATHAPLIISAPGIASNKTKSLSEHVDVFPTLCDLAGLAIPTQLQGKSLKSVMKNPATAVKEFSVSQYPRAGANEQDSRIETTPAIMGYSIRTSQYRYTIWMKNAFRSTLPFNAASVIGEELYDYNADPLEKFNVAKDKKYAPVTKKLHAEMLAYFKSQESKLAITKK